MKLDEAGQSAQKFAYMHPQRANFIFPISFQTVARGGPHLGWVVNHSLFPLWLLGDERQSVIPALPAARV